MAGASGGCRWQGMEGAKARKSSLATAAPHTGTGPGSVTNLGSGWCWW